jgi:catechol-2,3-dioxygenase
VTIAFSHVGIHVTDLAAMEAFYTRFLGFTVTDRGPLDTLGGRVDLVFLSRDPREHHQVVLATGRPADAGFNPINQISFRVDGLVTLREMHARLARERVSDVQSVSHGNALSVYFRDPEGNRIELFVDTPWHVPQPMRIPLDLSLPDEALWAWVEQTARARPGFQPRDEWWRSLAARMGPGSTGIPPAPPG